MKAWFFHKTNIIMKKTVHRHCGVHQKQRGKKGWLVWWTACSEPESITSWTDVYKRKKTLRSFQPQSMNSVSLEDARNLQKIQAELDQSLCFHFQGSKMILFIHTKRTDGLQSRKINCFTGSSLNIQRILFAVAEMTVAEERRDCITDSDGETRERRWPGDEDHALLTVVQRRQLLYWRWSRDHWVPPLTVT